jgi:hypothetical protein
MVKGSKMVSKWDLMNNWGIVLPPSRPSAWYLNLVGSYLRKTEKYSPVAVLGSTPEFLDLLYEFGFENVLVLDKSEQFHEAMMESRVYQGKEHFIKGDWLQVLPDLEGKCSLILSDLTSGNVSYDDRPLFYSLIQGALGPGGLFCDKILTHPGQNILISDLIEKYSVLPTNLLYANYFSSEMLFCSELLDIKQVVDTSLFYSILEDKLTNKRLLKFTQMAKLVTPPGCVWYYGKKWHDLKKDYCNGLILIEHHGEEKWSPYYGRLHYNTFQKSK